MKKKKSNPMGAWFLTMRQRNHGDKSKYSKAQRRENKGVNYAKGEIE